MKQPGVLAVVDEEDCWWPPAPPARVPNIKQPSVSVVLEEQSWQSMGAGMARGVSYSGGGVINQFGRCRRPPYTKR